MQSIRTVTDQVRRASPTTRTSCNRDRFRTERTTAAATFARIAATALAVLVMPVVSAIEAGAASVHPRQAQSEATIEQDDAAAPSEPPRAILIFDGSGSMWGRIGTSNKFEVARSALGAVLPSYDRSIALGLIVYGHRREANCNDIEVLGAPAIGQARDLIGSIVRLKPKGKTPIASSLESAATLLGPTRRGHIVVLTDGTENCRKDLCETVDAVREAAPGVTISTVALGLRPRDLAQLQCVAERGGGRAVVARSADELRDGIIAVFDDIASGTILDAGTVTAAVAPEPKPAQPLGDPRIELHALQSPTGPLIEDAVRWRITRTDTARPAPPLAQTARSPVLDLAPGSYRIEAQLGAATVRRDVTLTPGDTRSLHLPMNLARLDLALASPLARGETVVLTPEGASAADTGAATGQQPTIVARDGEKGRRFYLPPGAYTLRRTTVTGTDARPLRLAAGDAKRAAFTEQRAAVTIRTTRMPEGNPANAEPPMDLARHLTTVSRATDDVVDPLAVGSAPETGGANVSEDAWQEVARSAATAPTFSLEPGRYRVVSQLGHARTAREFTIDAPAAATIEMPHRVAQLTVMAENPTDFTLPRPLRLTLTPLGAPATRRLIVTSRTARPLMLSAGRWRVTMHAGDLNLANSAEVTLAANTTQTTPIGFNPARLVLETGKPESGQWRTTRWQIFSAQNTAPDGEISRTVWSGRGRRPTLLLMPGRYRIVARRDGKAATRTVDVVGGLTRTVRLTP
ncbi:MAG: VWA domain-containing protein [Pseudomonadota bacterium]